MSELRDRSGLEPEVNDYVMKNEDTCAFIDRLMALLEFTLPLYEREGKSSLTLALGCTGGRHRSVALVEELRKRLGDHKFRINVKHRDINR